MVNIVEKNDFVYQDLNDKWGKLVIEAMNSGVTKEQFKQFLKEKESVLKNKKGN